MLYNEAKIFKTRCVFEFIKFKDHFLGICEGVYVLFKNQKGERTDWVHPFCLFLGRLQGREMPRDRFINLISDTRSNRFENDHIVGDCENLAQTIFERAEPRGGDKREKQMLCSDVLHRPNDELSLLLKERMVRGEIILICERSLNAIPNAVQAWENRHPGFHKAIVRVDEPHKAQQ